MNSEPKAAKAKLMTTTVALVAAAVAVSLSFHSPSRAQDEERLSTAKLATPASVDLKKLDIYYADPASPNISGFWRPKPGTPRQVWRLADGTPLPKRVDASEEGKLPGQDGIPYTPAWQAAYTARRVAERDHHPYGDPAAACWPQGVYKAYIGYASPIEITQTPGRVLMQHERLNEVRRIYTDGRPHLSGADLIPTSHGDSIAHWEGKTLVVDTIGLRKEFTLSSAPGAPHSDAMHMIERFTRTDPVTLVIDITVEDKKALTQPIKTTLTYSLWQGDAMVEDFCSENNRNRPDANLNVVVDLTPRKHYGFDLPE